MLTAMKPEVQGYLNELMEQYPRLRTCKYSIAKAYKLLWRCYGQNGKLLTAGNGGSAADAEHIVGELMKSFKQPRPLPQAVKEKMIQLDTKRGSGMVKQLECPLPAISLTAHESLITAFLNDVGADGVFAQQVLGYGKAGDVFLGISTSGNSENVLEAAIAAKTMGLSVIGLTGAGGGQLAQYSDVCIAVPEKETFKVQEMHLPVYHCLCLMVEAEFFGEGAPNSV